VGRWKWEVRSWKKLEEGRWKREEGRGKTEIKKIEI
jgi:hypothetical protein